MRGAAYSAGELAEQRGVPLEALADAALQLRVICETRLSDT
jgi:hypothetical protein